MGCTSSKYIKKEDFHANFDNLQKVIEDLQNTQISFAEDAKQKEEHFEKTMEEMKEEQRKHVSIHLFSLVVIAR